MAAKSAGIRIFIWIIVNLFLFIGILMMLQYFEIWNYKSYFNEVTKDYYDEQEKVSGRKEEPFLLKQEGLKKREQSLEKKMEIFEARKLALKILQDRQNAFMLQVKVKMDEIHQREERLKRLEEEKNNREKNLKDVAEKLVNMPPNAVVARLEELDPLDVIDLFRILDKNALEAGQDSLVPIYLSRMDVKKSAEILRLKVRFPGEGPNDRIAQVGDEEQNAQDLGEPVEEVQPEEAEQPEGQ